MSTIHLDKAIVQCGPVAAKSADGFAPGARPRELSWPLAGLPTYRVGVVLTVIAAAATLLSMLVYLRAAWPELKR